MERVKRIINNFTASFRHKDVYFPLLIGFFLVFVHYLIPYEWVFYSNGSHEAKKIENELNQILNKFEQSRDSISNICNWEFYNPNQTSSTSIVSYKKYINGNQLTYWTNDYDIPIDSSWLNSSKNYSSISDSFLIVKIINKPQEKVLGIINLHQLIQKHWSIGIELFEKQYPNINYEIKLDGERSQINKSYTISYLKNKSFDIVKKNNLSDLNTLFLIFLVFVEAFLIIYGIRKFCIYSSRDHQYLSLITFFASLIVMRWVITSYKIPDFLYRLKIFNNTLYAGSSANPTLGDLLIFLVFNQLLILYIYKYFNPNVKKIRNWKISSFIIHTAVLIFFLGETFSMIRIFKNLIIDSSIWFNFNYFPRINIYSIVGLSIMLITFYNYFLVTYKALKLIWKFKLSKPAYLSSFGMTYIALVIYFSNRSIEYIIVAHVLFVLFSIIYFNFFVKRKLLVTTNVLMILFASILTTYLINFFVSQKEELVVKSLANEIGYQYDQKLKSKVIDYLNCIEYGHHTCNSIISENGLYIDQIPYYYQSNYNFYQKKLIAKNQKYNLYGTHTGSKFFYSIEDKSGQLISNIYSNNYLSKLNPNLKNEIQNQIIGENYVNYAVYINDSLIDYNGYYPFHQKFDYRIRDQNILVETEDTKNYRNQFFVYENNLKVVINSYSFQPISIFVLFSYIIGFNIILFSVFYMINAIIQSISYQNTLLWFQTPTLYKKITFSIMSLMLTIFISIAVLTTFNLKNRSNETKKANLLSQLKALKFSIMNSKYALNYASSETIDYLKKLSNSHNINFQIYHNSGYLMYDINNLYSKDLRPTAYIHPQLINIYNHKKIRNLMRLEWNKQDLYVAIDELSFINNHEKYLLVLTQNASSNWAKNDQTNFLISLINIYIFLFLLAFIVSFGISNLVTNPLKILTDKLSKLAISSQNEPIDYVKKDEIGQLVMQYNSMLANLESNVKQLASNERDNAWREMAKQIAHEIKNPLTPMRLKIQLVQRKINEGNTSNLEEDIQKLCDSLIEQIDNLTTITENFKNFAQFKAPNLEQVNLLDLIHNVCDLFDNIKDSTIEIRTSLDSAIVYADRDMLISCFNNLIKNGLQAALSIDRIPKIVVDISQVDEMYSILFIDNGGGIKDDIKANVFKPNFTTKSSGTGLGLAITKTFLDQMNGSISFFNNSDGATFEIRLPSIH